MPLFAFFSLCREPRLGRLQRNLLLSGLLVATVAVQPRLSQAQTQKAARKAEKFALLVGITDYDAKKGLTPLEGCLNDVDAMKASLVRNFGFQNDGAHILVLKNEAATRRGLIDAFRSQLTANAKNHPDATFLFYYSGHGSQVLDANGDEALLDPTDKFDETLVPFDATRDPKDREHFDLIDDDIQVLYDELQAVPRFSGQLTSIFDSCHSGTATRGARPLGDSHRHIKGITADSRLYPEGLGLGEKGLTADSRLYSEGLGLGDKGLTADSRSHSDAKGTITDSRLHPDGPTPFARAHSDNYVAFSGSMPTETSEERSFPELVNGREVLRPHGALTYYLLQAMEASSQKTTNGEVWQSVSQALNRYNQSPQLEGSSALPFLGGGTRSQAAPIAYTREGNTLTVTRGVEGGAVKGGFVELFRTALTKGRPKAGSVASRVPLGRFQITSAGVGRSKIVVPGSFKNLPLLPQKGMAQLLTPYFGQQPLRVGLGNLSDGPVAARLREFTRNNDFVQLSSAGEMADVTVVASTYGEAFPKGRPVESESHSAEEQGYFVSVRPGDAPLFSAWFKASSNGDISAADEIELRKTLDNFAAQSNVLALSNASVRAGKLAHAVRLEAFEVKGAMEGEIFVPDATPPVNIKRDSEGGIGVKDQDRVEFRLSNQTNERVYVALLWLSQDGSITAINDVDRRKVMVLKPKDENGSTARSSIYRVNPPFGCENLRLLVSSQPINVALLQREAVKRQGIEAASPFEMLIGQVLNTRGPVPRNAATNLSFDGWAVDDFRLTIGPNAKR